MPTLTVVNKHPQQNLGNINSAIRQYAGPASYVTGGDSIVPSDVKLSRILDIWPVSGLAINGAGAIRHLMYDASANLMLWFDNADPHAEIANGTDLSAFNTRLWIVEG